MHSVLTGFTLTNFVTLTSSVPSWSLSRCARYRHGHVGPVPCITARRVLADCTACCSETYKRLVAA
eukprot:2529004-Rhodomonas_salina.1